MELTDALLLIAICYALGLFSREIASGIMRSVRKWRGKPKRRTARRT